MVSVVRLIENCISQYAKRRDWLSPRARKLYHKLYFEGKTELDSIWEHLQCRNTKFMWLLLQELPTLASCIIKNKWQNQPRMWKLELLQYRRLGLFQKPISSLCDTRQSDTARRHVRVSHCDGQNSLFYRINRDLKDVIPFETILLKCHFKGLGWIA